MGIRVTVVLFGALREVAGAAEMELELDDGAMVRDVLAACGLPDRVDIWSLLDGERAGRDALVSDGAQVNLFQPVGGG